jgi:CHAT domain-containing protein
MKLINQLVVSLILVLSLPSLATDTLTAFQRGDFEQAVQTLESTRAHFNIKNAPTHYIDISVRLAIAYQKIGLLQKAKTILCSLKSSVSQKNDPVRYAIVLSHLSDVYLAMGHPQKEICSNQNISQEKTSLYIDKALEIAQAHNQPQLFANFLNKKANLLMAQGECDRALSTYYDSVQKTKKFNDKAFEIQIWMNIAQAIVQSGDYEFVENKFGQSVFELFVTILQQIQILPDSHHKAFSLIGLAKFMRQLQKMPYSQKGQPSLCNQFANLPSSSPTIPATARGNETLPPLSIDEMPFLKHSSKHAPIISSSQIEQLYQHTYHALEQAFEIAKKIQDARAMSYAKGYLGQLYEDAKRYDEAIQLTRQALFYAQKHYYYPQLLYLWQWQLGRIFKTQELFKAATSAYQQAIEHLESDNVRDSLKGGYRCISQPFRKNTGALYFQLTDLLLQEAWLETDVLRQQAQLEKAKNSIEKFKQAELRDYFQDDCLFERQQSDAKLEIDKALPKQTAVLYPIMLENRLELLLSIGNDTQQFVNDDVNDVQCLELENEVKQFRHQLRKSTSDEETDIQTHAKKLYDCLIKPIAKKLEIQQIDTLVIVPDGILLTIPFAALYDGKEYLINKNYALVVTPSLNMPALTPMPRENMRILLGGYSNKITTKGVIDFNALPNVPTELQEIRTQLGNDKFQFTSLKEFTFSQLQSELEKGVKTRNPYRIIHLATHGRFGSNPNNTFLVTADKKYITINELSDLIGINALKSPIELLTLSACQTALGNDRAALGLAGIALKAGARSAVASLWLVDDPATAQLMPKFYNHLKNKEFSKAQALQQAQREMLKIDEYSHPYYWAAFLFIGNWL